MKELLPYVRRAAGAEPDDARLLANFASRRDAEAFATLVRRHGPLVRGVCRRWLRDAADVDDAFQATFLVLVRRAQTIAEPALLAGWLHGVARRTARNLRHRLLRHQRRFAANVDLSRTEAPPTPIAEFSRWLDDEINRLPEKYRLPVVLCHLQGRSRREAARLLACPEGTLSVRLARALDLLRRRLIRRGIVPAAAAALVVPATSEAIPPLLVRATVRAAVQSAAPERIVRLTEGVLRMFVIERLTRAAGCLLAAAALLAGGTLMLNHLANGPQALAEPPAKPAAPPPIVLVLKTVADGSKIEQIDVTEGDDRITVHSLPALGRYLRRARLDKSASNTVVLRAGAETKYATVVGVLDLCRLSGFEKVNMENAPPTVARLDGPWQIEVRWPDHVTDHTIPLNVQLRPEVRERLEIVPMQVRDIPLNFEWIQRNFDAQLKSGVKIDQVQAEWTSDLMKFLEQSPEAVEAPQAILQIALNLEFSGKPAEARKWYERLAKQVPATREAVKARGSLKRLGSVGQPFELDSTTLAGQRFRIGDLKGKVVAVYYWASWNATARSEFAKLQTLRAQFPDQFEVVAVNLDDESRSLREFLSPSPLKGVVHVHEKGGFDSRLAADYGISMLPTLFLLDRDGKVVRHDLTIPQLEDEVKKLVK
jgi:RNA polymerase sigma factor (sigma-70 family)